MIVLRGWDRLFAVISNNKLAFYKDQKHYKTVCFPVSLSDLELCVIIGVYVNIIIVFRSIFHPASGSLLLSLSCFSVVVYSCFPHCIVSVKRFLYSRHSLCMIQ